MSAGLINFLIKQAIAVPGTTLQPNRQDTTLQAGGVRPHPLAAGRDTIKAETPVPTQPPAPAPAPVIPPQYQDWFGNASKYNKGFGQLISEGKFTQNGARGQWTPSEQYLQKIHSDPALQQVWMKSSKDPSVLYNSLKGPDEPEYAQVNYANYRKSKLQDTFKNLGLIRDGEDLTNPVVQARLKGFTTTEQDIANNITNPVTQSAQHNIIDALTSGVANLPDDASTNPEHAISNMGRGISFLRDHNGDPEALRKANDAFDKYKELNQARLKSGLDQQAFIQHLKSLGADADQLSAASQDPKALQEFANKANYQTDQGYKDWSTKNQESSLPFDINKKGISDQIPWMEQLKYGWGELPTGAKWGIGLGGGALLTYLLHKLFSSGEQQPVVNNNQQGPQQLSYGRTQNRNNLV